MSIGERFKGFFKERISGRISESHDYQCPTVPVRIITIPEGCAPDNFRSSWVGLTVQAIPLEQAEGLWWAQRIAELETPDWDYKNGVLVSQKEALEVLAKKAPDAAEWFRNNFHGKHKMLYFGRGVVEEVIQGNT